MDRRHEQSVIDGFSRFFERRAFEAGRRLIRCSLDGQDSVLGGDYIFTTNTRFALVEFKYEEADLKAEVKKHLRRRLCLALEREPQRLEQSLQCHFIGWSRPGQRRTVHFNQYYPEICNRSIFQDEDLLNNFSPDPASRMQSDTLIDSFLEQKIGGVYAAFKLYTEWLLSLAGDDEGGIELMVDDPDSNDLRLIDFPSLPEMKQWLDQHKPPNRPRPSFGSGM